jgi:PAS domain S-box-containing protein
MLHFTDVAHRVRSLLRTANVERVTRELAAPPDELEARILAAEALARSEERLRLTMEATALGTFEWDIATDRVHCSPRVKQQFGFSSEEALTLDSVVTRIHPADREPVRKTIHAAMETDGPRTFAGEFRTLLPDGRSAWIDARGAVLFSRLNTCPQCMIGIVLDITERKMQQIRLDRSAADLSTANQLKDEFMASLAHKLRFPLTPIRNGLDILALSGYADPAQRKACDLMERQLRHLVHLVDELLDASLVSCGTLSLNRHLVTLQSVARRAIDIVREQLDTSEHELRLEVPREPVLLEVDPLRIAQAVANVVENGVRYTPRPGRIILRAAADANGAAIQIIDNGNGISPCLLPHLFDLFATKLPSDRAHVAGLGLGLALSHALVKMHGGSMSVTSDGLGSGSAFRIWLPTVNGSTADSSRGTTRFRTPPRRRVLVVDGDADSVELNLTLLQLMDQDVRHAGTERAALEVAGEFMPQVVLAAEGTEEVDGYGILRSLRALPLPEPPILVLMGDGERPGASIADAYLRTPVDAAAIARILIHPPLPTRALARVVDAKPERAS